MQIENARQLHLFLGKDALRILDDINLSLFKKKYPGDHVALVRPEDKAAAEAIGFFSEVHTLNLSYIQRSSFSPLLGDEVAFNHFFESLKPLTSQKWFRLFNLKGSIIDSAISELFHAQAVIGTCAKGNERRCQEAPLKLLALLEQWGMGHPALKKWLTTKTFGQLDWTSTEVSLQRVIDCKNQKTNNSLKALMVGVDVTQMRATHPAELNLLEQFFTVVDLSKQDPVMALFVDLVVESKTSKWNYSHSLNHMDPDSLSEALPEAIERSLNKWACLSALFDYLGNARAALAAEKIMARYDRDSLQQFLFSQVMGLKTFARILLDGIRRQGSDIKGPLETYWSGHANIISFNSAIELSLHSSVTPLLRNDQDVLAIKRRMRTVNQFYERLHRASALEIPKTDLELTL
jgi:hypothetical protein